MKGVRLLIFALFLAVSALPNAPTGLSVYAQDQKVTELAEDTSPTCDDLFYKIDDPSGTPASRKVTGYNYWCVITTNTPPTVNDDTNDGYVAGKVIWHDLSGGTVHVLEDASAGAAVWQQIYPQTSTVTLDNAFDNGKTIDGANSLANAFRVGDGSGVWCLYAESGEEKLRPCTAKNTATTILTDFTWSLFDEEGDAAIETVDPDAASPDLIWSYPTATYRPKGSIWFGAEALFGDGTQCPSDPTAVTINSGPIMPTFICADNDGSTLYGQVRMPDSWDGGTVTFTHIYIQTAADTAVLNGDIACQARSNGEVPSSTWGTEIAIDDAAVVGSNSSDQTTSAAVTCAGTGLAGGDMLFFRYQLDATGTTTAVATLHHVAFNMEYTKKSRSD